MRLLVWNMGGGFGYSAEQHDRAWRFLQEADPDVALLQEAVPPDWADDAWPFVLRTVRYPDRDVPWGAAIVAREASTEAFTPTDGTPWLRSLWGAVAVARLGGLQPIWLASVHSNAYPLKPEQLEALPPEGLLRCDEKSLWEIEGIAPELARLFGDSPFIAGGDLNSSLLFDQRENKSSNARLFGNLASLGFSDLRRPFSENEQQTYFKKGKGPYQLDHVFADASTAGRATSWQVLRHVAEGDELSDHAPIEVRIDP